jgi:isopentenyl-diphosphate delta-isomerase
MGYQALNFNILGTKKAIQRKLYQELGIKDSAYLPENLQFLTKIHYFSKYDSHWSEHEIDYIFILKSSVNLDDLNFNEVEDVEWISKEKLKDILNQKVDGVDIVTPWFRLICSRFLFEWWECLDNLEQFMDNKIHSFI